MPTESFCKNFYINDLQTAERVIEQIDFGEPTLKIANNREDIDCLMLRSQKLLEKMMKTVKN